jgi:antitoxin component YwqK of YwqJK toxin-antitoxin module
MNEEVNWERDNYDNGQLEYEIPYVNGKQHGIEKSWYENGQLSYEIPYVNDQRHGIERGWHPNGQLGWETPYENDQRHGIRKHWKKDGTLWRIEKWHKGRKFINLRFNPLPADSIMELDLITNEMSYERRS